MTKLYDNSDSDRKPFTVCNNKRDEQVVESNGLEDETREVTLLSKIIKKETVEHNNGKVTFGKAEQIFFPESKSDSWEDIQQEQEDEGLQNNEKQKQFVIIDVGGERYQANRDSFLKYPNTRLGKLMNSSSIVEILTLCEEYIPGNPPEYFFDKNPENFPSVLEMYRSGNFHIPDSGRGNISNLIMHNYPLNHI